MDARLRSLEEIDSHRSGFADAARMVLVNANGKVGQMGAVADFLEVEPRYERAVEACMGDLLQHVLVERLEHVMAGLKLIRQEEAGRCGFIVGRPDGGAAIVSNTGAAVEPAHVQTYVQTDVHAFVPAVASTLATDAPPAIPDGAIKLSSVVRVGGPFPQAIQAVLGGALIAETFETAARIAQIGRAHV